MTTNQRERVLVDKRLQRALAKRIVMYWSVTWLVVFSLPILIRTFTEQLPFDQLANEIVGDFWFPIAISIFLLPIVVWDSFRFSNRIAGPVHRVSEAIRSYESEGPVETIRVRDEDFCQTLVNDVNSLIGMMETGVENRESEDSSARRENSEV